MLSRERGEREKEREQIRVRMSASQPAHTNESDKIAQPTCWPSLCILDGFEREREKVGGE